ncbi:phosphoglycolate phosphatase [Varunaivibrio sulfuroxidans]|uniref:Phosphoglycolate phosphatase n=1 Tax=Varunaivibrio sulfuroxidans TaxID=1773489 RepID=A0A4R3J842_9PROT|nr:phosphoglycolate phosphatase [Varunaivibrio sulfuroxidans]TCS61604.1 phosphoglycolate phosphatase [Varunaivibrio sulfuroxidans]WES29521.1 phosphoglycolate phosphatase [Varunaivibrio sulfuroxidans]
MIDTTHRGPLKAVLFDLDGTLIDSAPDLHGAANHMLTALGRREVSLREVQMMIGDGVPMLVQRCFAATGDTPDADALAEHTRRYVEYYEPRSTVLTALYPGATDALAALKDRGVGLAICTNKVGGATMEILAKLGIDHYFDCVIAGDTLPGIKKPDPRHLGAALERLETTAENAVMIGDNANDVIAAHGANLPIVLLGHGYTKIPVHELGGEAVIDHFDQLPQVLRRFGG